MELITRTCPHHRCGRPVATVLVVGKTGGHKEETIDVEPVDWEHGGRIKLRDFQPNTAKHYLVTRYLHARQAFGATLYRPHSQSCPGGTGRTAPRSRETS